MAWVAFDRAIKSAEAFNLEGPLDRWRRLCRKIHDDVCRRGFDRELGSFVRSYDSRELDASLLLGVGTGVCGAPSRGTPDRIVAVSDFSGLASSACALASAAAIAPIDSLDRCMASILREEIETDRS